MIKTIIKNLCHLWMIIIKINLINNNYYYEIINYRIND